MCAHSYVCCLYVCVRFILISLYIYSQIGMKVKTNIICTLCKKFILRFDYTRRYFSKCSEYILVDFTRYISNVEGLIVRKWKDRATLESIEFPVIPKNAIRRSSLCTFRKLLCPLFLIGSAIGFPKRRRVVAF